MSSAYLINLTTPLDTIDGVARLLKSLDVTMEFWLGYRI
jgi:hypothetical protein